MGDDELRLGKALDEPREVVCDRRKPAAAVDEDGHTPVGGDLEDGREPLVVQEEPLGTRMELDPARAAVEAARRLLDRALREVEADEGDEPPTGALGVLERAVVRGAESRVPVGLVEAEHECARDPEAPLDPLELLVVAAEAVEVGAEVDVRVEDVCAFGELAPELLLPRPHQLLGTRMRFLHALSLSTSLRPPRRSIYDRRP